MVMKQPNDASHFLFYPPGTCAQGGAPPAAAPVWLHADSRSVELESIFDWTDRTGCARIREYFCKTR